MSNTRALSRFTLSPANLAWIPALMGIAVICGESTNVMGAGHTGIWLSQLAAAAGYPNGPIALLNHLLRKTGHFTGYGLLGICFARGWHSWLRRRVSGSWTALRLRAASLGIASALVVASADEIHQIFLPTRGASVWDVLLDTSGALTLNLLFLGYLTLRRNALTNPAQPFVTLGLSLANIPQGLSATRGTFRLGVQRAMGRPGLMRINTSSLSRRTFRKS